MYLDIGDGPNAAIRHVQQVTAKPQKIARDLEINNLLLSIQLELAGTGPSRRENVSRLIRSPLMYQIAHGDKHTTALMQAFEHGKLRL